MLLKGYMIGLIVRFTEQNLRQKESVKLRRTKGSCTWMNGSDIDELV